MTPSAFDGAERLVVVAYRRAMHAVEADGRFSVPALATTLSHAGGMHSHAIAAHLGSLLSTLLGCATCPLRYGAPGQREFSREETLFVGLIAAIQHGDEEAAGLGAIGLTCVHRCMALAEAAGPVAMLLKADGHILLPVAAADLAGLVARNQPADPDQPAFLH